MPRNRYETALDALGVLAPIAALLTVVGYSRDRMRTAWKDERGLSHTVEVAIWAGVAAAAVIAVGAIIVVAIRNRSTDVGEDIENSPLP